MTDLHPADALIDRLARVRTRLLEAREWLHAVDHRTEDITWPCEQYATVGIVEFDSRNTCLIAEPPRSTLWLGRPILDDMVEQLPEHLRDAAGEWFFVHQLVHVSQGLRYRDFRVLNRVGNRHETMRPDCDADYISLKTLALLAAQDERADSSAYVIHIDALLDDLVPAMIRMDPNIFIPRARDIEIRRIFALLLLRYYFTQAVEHGFPSPDASFFPWWSEDYDHLYVFVGQVCTLGRGPLPIGADKLRDIIERLYAGDIDEAYARLTLLDWPPLHDSTLPHRLMR
jgi:hypothetical protein